MGQSQSDINNYKPYFTIIPPILSPRKPRNPIYELNLYSEITRNIRNLLDYKDEDSKGINCTLFLKPEKDAECVFNVSRKAPQENAGNIYFNYYSKPIFFALDFGVNNKTSENRTENVSNVISTIGYKFVPYAFSYLKAIKETSNPLRFEGGSYFNYKNFALGIHAKSRNEFSGWCRVNVNENVQVGAETEVDFSESSFKTRKSNFALAYTSKPNNESGYQLSLISENFGELIKIAYFQRMIVTRFIKNPVEEQNITRIKNYLEYGVELTQTKESSKFAIGASWQLNKNLLLKGKIDLEEAYVLCGFKSWWEPSILVFFTSNWKLHQDPKYGVNIIIENTEEEEKETKTLVYHGYEK